MPVKWKIINNMMRSASTLKATLSCSHFPVHSTNTVSYVRLISLTIPPGAVSVNHNVKQNTQSIQDSQLKPFSSFLRHNAPLSVTVYTVSIHLFRVGATHYFVDDLANCIR